MECNQRAIPFYTRTRQDGKTLLTQNCPGFAKTANIPLKNGSIVAFGNRLEAGIRQAMRSQVAGA